jgi:hypothetical protein
MLRDRVEETCGARAPVNFVLQPPAVNAPTGCLLLKVASWKPPRTCGSVDPCAWSLSIFSPSGRSSGYSDLFFRDALIDLKCTEMVYSS